MLFRTLTHGTYTRSAGSPLSYQESITKYGSGRGAVCGTAILLDGGEYTWTRIIVPRTPGSDQRQHLTLTICGGSRLRAVAQTCPSWFSYLI